MLIQIASDIHLEQFHENIDFTDVIRPVGDMLILAGDIGSIYRQHQLNKFLEQACGNFPMVIYVPGNHEYYRISHSKKNRKFSYLSDFMCQFTSKFNNFYFLDKDSIQVENFLFIGTTLWSNPKSLPSRIVRIPNMTLERYKSKHKIAVEYIKNQKEWAKNQDLIPIVITHYPPVDTKEVCTRKTDFRDLYTNKLENLTKGVKIWICGHTHKNFSLTVNDCTLISNQLGKPKDNISDFDPAKLIEV